MTASSSRRSAATQSRWFRYNFDGYGETNDGGPLQRAPAAAGCGRSSTPNAASTRSPARGNGSAGAPYLAALKAFSTPQGFISEQIWNPSTTLPGDMDNLPAGS